MNLLAVDGSELGILEDGSVYFQEDDRRTWFIRVESLTPELHRAVAELEEQWAGMLKGFLEGHRTELEGLKKRGDDLDELYSGHLLEEAVA
jgi:hypothetical protein